MFSKSLFAALSLLMLTASSALGAPALSCPAQSTVTVVTGASSSAAASNVAVASSSVISSAAASATSASSTKGKGGDGNGGKGKDGKGKGGAKGATTTAASSTEAVTSTDSSAASSNIAAASSSAISSATSSATSSSTTAVGSTGKGGDKGAAGSSAASSAVSSASVTAASSSASTTAASSSVASGTSISGDDEQSATTLNPSVIATGFAQNGQQVPAAGQVASLTSTNNFINFCLTVNKPITNGQQIKTGSCNPAPMGVIAATTNMPSSKFTFPTNGGTVQANKEFTITMAINNLQAGNFVNAQSNYYSAPQQVNSAGNVIGHSHVVIEQLSSLNQTTPTDPTKFAFFKGINGAAVNGVITADVTDGLPAGAYRLASINSAANHQPVLVAVAQHGSLDDMVYFTVQ